MITTFPLVVALAAFTSRADDPPEVRSIAAGVRVAGGVVGLLAPLTVSWVGEIFPMGDPFRVHW
jgi:hypothetical protein